MVSSAPSTSSASNQWANLSFVEVLEDLSSRFIVNLPSEELQRIERICFQVEQAHWFYEDFLRPLNDKLPSLNLRKFSIYILQTASLSVPLIRQYISSGSEAIESGAAAVQDWQSLGGKTYGLEAAFDEFMKYKTRVPVCGAVLLTEDLKSCLLVKGWKSSAAWGFPKGKINQSESHRDCAVRETYEETGFDCSHLLEPDSTDWMELNVREQKMRLYIVPGVSRDTVFETQTRKEISKIAWFKLSELPTWKQMNHNSGPAAATAAASSSQGPAGGAKKFYLVTPFIGKLKQWIGQNKKRVLQAQGLATESAKGSAAPTEPAAMRAEPSQQLGVLPKEPCVAAAPTLVEAASPWPLTSNGPTNGNRTNAADLPKQDDSAALLAMLQGSLQINPPPPPPQAETNSNPLTSQQQLLLQSLQPSQQLRKDNDSPLPAPRPQKSSGQTLKLLEMLSPRTPQAPEPQASAEDSAAEDMARKRQALLQGLMGAGSGPPMGAGYVEQGSQQQGGQEQQLLDMLRGQNTSHQQVAPQNAVHPSFPPHQGGQYGHPPSINGKHHLSPHVAHLQASHQMPYPGSPDAGRSDLLAMLNAGPMQRNGGGQTSVGHYPGPFPGHQYPPQHQAQPTHNSTFSPGPPQPPPFAGYPGHQQQGYIPPPPSFGPAPPHAHAHISQSPQYGHQSHLPQQHAFGQLHQEPSNVHMNGHNVNPAFGIQQQHTMSPQMSVGGQQPATGGVGTGGGGSGGNAALLAMLNGR